MKKKAREEYKESQRNSVLLLRKKRQERQEKEQKIRNTENQLTEENKKLDTIKQYPHILKKHFKKIWKKEIRNCNNRHLTVHNRLKYLTHLHLLYEALNDINTMRGIYSAKKKDLLT
jgi:hypothetical protein